MRPALPSARYYSRFIGTSNRFPGLFGSPYDESNAIFILDRQSREYDFSGVVDRDYMKQCTEKKEFVWSLVDDDGQLSKAGPKDVAKRYKSQIKKKSQNFTIALEWKVRTNAAGWSIDVPKDTPTTKQK